MTQQDIPSVVTNRGLFRDYYLANRLTPELAGAYPDAQAALAGIAATWNAAEGALAESEENVTMLVGKVCEILGMAPSGQTKVKAGDASQRIDITLFADAAAAQAFTQAKRTKDEPARYANALVVIEVEKLGAEFDTGKNDNSNPSQQIVNYLTFTKLPWGILTDGARWRLYRRFDPPDRTRCLEIDLRALLKLPAAEREPAFRWFYAFFGKTAFDHLGQTSFLDRVWAGSEQYAVEVQETLREQAFEVVESLAQGIYAAANPKPPDADLPKLYEQAIVILYRLLFIKFAEDRGILPPAAATAQQKNSYWQAYGFRSLQIEVLGLCHVVIAPIRHNACCTELP